MSINHLPIRPSSGDAFEEIVVRYLREVKFPTAEVQRFGRSGQKQPFDILVHVLGERRAVECKNWAALPDEKIVREIVSSAWESHLQPAILYVAVAHERDAGFQSLIERVSAETERQVAPLFWNDICAVCNWPHNIEDIWLSWRERSSYRLDQADSSQSPLHQDRLACQPRLSNPLFVPRAAEVGLFASLEAFPTSLRRLRMVVGEAGFGKTAVLWHVATTSETNGFDALYLHAEDLRDSTDIDQLRQALIWRQFMGRRPLLLLDTADALSESSRIRLAGHVAGWLNAGIDVVVACRRIEATAFGTWRDLYRKPNGLESEWIESAHVLHLGLYTADEWKLAVDTHARGWAAQYGDSLCKSFAAELIETTQTSSELLEVVSTPLTLRMLFELYSPESPPPASRLRWFALYQDYWRLRVEQDGRLGSTDDPSTENLANATEILAIRMLALGKVETALPVTADKYSRDGIRLLEKRGVVRGVAAAGGGTVYRFWHQTFLEHAGARAISSRFGLNSVAVVEKQLERNNESMWLQPVLEHLLLLRESEEDFSAWDYVISQIRHTHGNRRRTGLRVLVRAHSDWPRSFDDEVRQILIGDALHSELPDFVADLHNMSPVRTTTLLQILEWIWPRVMRDARPDARILMPAIGLCLRVAPRCPERIAALMQKLDVVGATVHPLADDDGQTRLAQAALSWLEVEGTFTLGTSVMIDLLSRCGASRRRTQLVTIILSGLSERPSTSDRLGAANLAYWQGSANAWSVVKDDEDARTSLARVVANGLPIDFLERRDSWKLLDSGSHLEHQIWAGIFGHFIAFRALPSTETVAQALNSHARCAIFGQISIPAALTVVDEVKFDATCAWVRILFLSQSLSAEFQVHYLIGFRTDDVALHRAVLAVFEYENFQSATEWMPGGRLSAIAGAAVAAGVSAARRAVEEWLSEIEKRVVLPHVGVAAQLTHVEQSFCGLVGQQICSAAFSSELLMELIFRLARVSDNGARLLLRLVEIAFPTDAGPRVSEGTKVVISEDGDDTSVSSQVAAQHELLVRIARRNLTLVETLIRQVEREGSLKSRVRGIRLMRLATLAGAPISWDAVVQKATIRGRSLADSLLAPDGGPLRVATVSLLATILRSAPIGGTEEDALRFLSMLGNLDREDKALAPLFDCWAAVLGRSPILETAELAWQHLGEAEHTSIVHLGRMGKLIDALTRPAPRLALTLLQRILAHSVARSKSSQDASPRRQAAARLRSPVAGLFLSSSIAREDVILVVENAQTVAPEIGRILLENAWRHRQSDVQDALLGVASDARYPHVVKEVSRRQQVGRATGEVVPWPELLTEGLRTAR